MKKYRVHSMFLTLQGEGCHSGSAAVFVRFAGCNVWSGLEADREKHTARGFCARWCDTEFVGYDETQRGGKYSAEALVAAVASIANGTSLVVCTGGEPSLQLDDALVRALHGQGFRVHVETNGSRQLPEVDWVTVSPKPPMPVVTATIDELKIVAADEDPLGSVADLVEAVRAQGGAIWIQPLDTHSPRDQREADDKAVSLVLNNPWARLSLQTHKYLEIP